MVRRSFPPGNARVELVRSEEWRVRSDTISTI